MVCVLVHACMRVYVYVDMDVCVAHLLTGFCEAYLPIVSNVVDGLAANNRIFLTHTRVHPPPPPPISLSPSLRCVFA